MSLKPNDISLLLDMLRDAWVKPVSQRFHNSDPTDCSPSLTRFAGKNGCRMFPPVLIFQAYQNNNVEIIGEILFLLLLII